MGDVISLDRRRRQRKKLKAPQICVLEIKAYVAIDAENEHEERLGRERLAEIMAAALEDYDGTFSIAEVPYYEA